MPSSPGVRRFQVNRSGGPTITQSGFSTTRQSQVATNANGRSSGRWAWRSIRAFQRSRSTGSRSVRTARTPNTIARISSPSASAPRPASRVTSVKLRQKM